MFERYGLERDDYRNLLIVSGIVALVTVWTSGEPFAVRTAVGLVTGLVGGVTFLVATVIINIFKPDHW
jgi:hypothetical protein